jgi:hypothetical protein
LQTNAGGCVTVRSLPMRYVPRQRVAHDLTPRQRAVLAMLEASTGGLALREMRSGLGHNVAEWKLKSDLAFLKQLEPVEPAGRGRGAYWSLRRK